MSSRSLAIPPIVLIVLFSYIPVVSHAQPRISVTPFHFVDQYLKVILFFRQKLEKIIGSELA